MYTKTYNDGRERGHAEVTMKRLLWILNILGVFLVLSLAFMGCDNGTTSSSGPVIPPYTPEESTGGGGGGGNPPTQAITDGSFALADDDDLTPADLTASASRNLVTGDVTVTLGSTAPLNTGLLAAYATPGSDVNFNLSLFNAVEAAKLDYFAFTLVGLTGSPVSTTIRQYNGALVIFRGEPEYHVTGTDVIPPVFPTPPDPQLDLGHKYEYTNGTIFRQKKYDGNLSTFDLSILIADGKGPVKLEIYPDDAEPYTVTVNYDAVKFSGTGVAVGDKDNYVTAPTPGAYGTAANSYAGTPNTTITVSGVTQQAGTFNYTAKVASANPIGGSTNVPITVGTAMAAETSLWPTGDSNINIMTLSFQDESNNALFTGYTSGGTDIIVKQVNPAFAVYEAKVYEGMSSYTPATPSADGFYTPNSEYKWSDAYNANPAGHILYKEEATPFDIGGLANFNFAIKDLENEEDEVVIFTFTFPVAAGQPDDEDNDQYVTRSFKIDYSGVKF
jgi:hypothetical protein